ncbi:hypothetical protein SOV_22520 [Sporomusa ovata DSM 2662]|uniref:hypothetical protein n=1 Tax=Sporomusa ovata TaxID=2378 RepID=UPI0003885580|nr:hypothetical protein [Sporomusa ovata]EQB25568.1 hypothetical protein SOV_4c02310 [Sporomusa ovata DSM 2662]
MSNKICPLMSSADKQVECQTDKCGFWFKDLHSSTAGCSLPLAVSALRAKK